MLEKETDNNGIDRQRKRETEKRKRKTDPSANNCEYFTNVFNVCIIVFLY